MRRLTVGFLALTILTSGGVSAPLWGIDFAYLFVLHSEITGRGQAPPLQSEESGTIEGREVVEASPSPATRRRGDEKAEFDRICGQVQVAPSLTAEQLQQLVEDCDALIERLKVSENPQAKILIKRIQMCRDFFEYSIDVMAEE